MSEKAPQTYRIGPCPFKFIPLEDNEAIKARFLGYIHGLVRSEPEGWILGGQYGDLHADEIYNFELRDDDFWIVTYPKSGTTWMQHTMWMLLNDLDFGESQRVDLRSPFLDFDQCIPKEKFSREMAAKRELLLQSDSSDPFLKVIEEELAFMKANSYEDAAQLPESKPRLIKSHLPFALMPPDLIKRNKVVYVARDPRDVVVSYYHHHRLNRHLEFIGDFKGFFRYFLHDKVLWSPYWKHIAQAWQERESNNLLFVFFSDMKESLPDVVDDLCQFLTMVLWFYVAFVAFWPWPSGINRGWKKSRIPFRPRNFFFSDHWSTRVEALDWMPAHHLAQPGCGSLKLNSHPPNVDWYPPPPLNWRGQGPHTQGAHMGGTLGRHPNANHFLPEGVKGSSQGVYPLYHTCERQKKKVTIMEDNNTESSV